jgi:hypothetical protein
MVLLPEAYPSSSFSNGFGSSEDGWLFPIPFGEVKRQTPSTHYSNINGRLVDDMGLSETFHRMHIGDEQRDGFGFGDGYFGRTIPWSGEHEGFSNGASGFEGFQSSHHGVPASFNDDTRLALLGLWGGSKEIIKKFLQTTCMRCLLPDWRIYFQFKQFPFYNNINQNCISTTKTHRKQSKGGKCLRRMVELCSSGLWKQWEIWECSKSTTWWLLKSPGKLR